MWARGFVTRLIVVNHKLRIDKKPCSWFFDRLAPPPPLLFSKRLPDKQRKNSRAAFLVEVSRDQLESSQT